MRHPPWLRFQAFVVGLPKTGTTSVAAVFGNYRSGHEIGRSALVDAGLRRRAGAIDDTAFWDLTTPRLTRPALEMDSVTCHHLYTDALVQRFPNAVFVHTVRDVGGWLTSLLDMSMRYRYACSLTSRYFSEAEDQYFRDMTGGVVHADTDPRAVDRDAIIPLMRYWAEHIDEMAGVLPAGRSLRVRTRDIGVRVHDLAALCGVPVQSLRPDLSWSNAGAHTLDRLALYDSPEIRAAYEQYCADIMARLFPQEHARAFGEDAPGLDWERHCDATREWVIRSAADRGASVSP